MFRKVSVVSVVMVAIIATAVIGAAEESWLGPELSVLQKVYDDCLDKDDFTGCLKGKALGALNKAIEQDSISIVDGLSMEKQNASEVEASPEFADARVLSDLSGIDRELMQKVSTFFRTHVVKVDFSQGRGGGGVGGGGIGGNKNKLGGKQKKSSRYILAALIAAMGIAGPLGLKAIAVIAGKALIISKIALTIAGIIALKKIYSSEHHDTQVQVLADHNRRNAFLNRPYYKHMSYSDHVEHPYRHYYDSPSAQPQN